MTMNGCIICDSVGSKDIMVGIKKCNGCGLIYASIKPSDTQIEKIYGADYFMGRVYSDYIKEAAAHKRNFDRRIKELIKHVEKPGETDVFEIGSAYGFFLQTARMRFRSVRGIDITTEGCCYAREMAGLDVTCGDFLKTVIEKNKFGVFCMWDTIEHLKEPQLYIKKISENIKRGGILSLTTGDIGSAVAKISGKKWRIIHPPEHLYYFSRKTISGLLEKYGFRVEEIKYCGNYRSMRTILSAFPVIGRLCGKSEFFDMPVYINLYDIMHVIARKDKDAA